SAAEQRAVEHESLAGSHRAELESERQAREAAAREAEATLATVRRDWDSERSDWATERARIDSAARDAQAENERVVSGLNEQVKAATERGDALAREADGLTAARAQLDSELERSRKEVQSLQAQLLQAQDFKHQIRTFLAGLGIRLPS